MVHYGVHVGNFSIHGASGHQWGYWNGECIPPSVQGVPWTLRQPKLLKWLIASRAWESCEGVQSCPKSQLPAGMVMGSIERGFLLDNERGLKHQKSGENGGIIWCNGILMGNMFEAFVTIELMSVIDLFWSIYFRVKSCKGKCLSSENLIHMR